MDHQIIFETMTGSHLYGTNGPVSDYDFTGIFMPNQEDLLGISPGQQEMKLDVKLSEGPRNTAGDTDRKFYSVQKFLKLAAEGQSGVLEMLFSPRQCWVYPTRPMACVWSDILKNRDLFLSQQSIVPFIGFATAQAHKATLKAGNLNLIRELIETIEHITYKERCIEAFVSDIHGWRFVDIPVEVVEVEYRPGILMKCIMVAGRKFEFTQSVKHLQQKLKEYESRYGTRSQVAATEGQDYKSLMHAYRLIYEAEDILTKGELVLPFDKKRVKFLLSIRNGEYETDYYKEIEENIKRVKSIKSQLPMKVNKNKISKLCQQILLADLVKDI